MGNSMTHDTRFCTAHNRNIDITYILGRILGCDHRGCTNTDCVYWPTNLPTIIAHYKNSSGQYYGMVDGYGNITHFGYAMIGTSLGYKNYTLDSAHARAGSPSRTGSWILVILGGLMALPGLLALVVSIGNEATTTWIWICAGLLTVIGGGLLFLGIRKLR